MMNCVEATRLISDAQEHTLSTRDRLALQVHLLLCKGCKNFSLQIPFLRRTMRGYSERVDAVLQPSEQPQGGADAP